MFRTLFAIVCILAGHALAQVFDIPRIENITIDGKSDDWNDNGFAVEIMAGDDGKLRAGSEFASDFRLAWDNRGLLVLANATDNTPTDAPTGEFWRGDAIELYLARKQGSADYFQIMLAPPRVRETKLRKQIVHLRKREPLKATPLKIE